MPSGELIPSGLYEASLAKVHKYPSAWGDRIGFVFRITEGEYTGKLVTLSTATNLGRMSKLGQTLHGLLARELTDYEIRDGSARVPIRSGGRGGRWPICGTVPPLTVTGCGQPGLAWRGIPGDGW